MKEKLMGVFSPIATPFTEDGTLNYEGLKNNLKKYAGTGLKGYLALGSNGENKSLTNDEKLKVLETIVNNKGENQTVIAGCIFESTMETIEMAKKMEQLKPDFIALLPPSYFKKQMTDDVLYQYFVDCADSVSVPCLLYNAPQYAGGVGLSVSLIERCSKHPNIVGIKDSSSGNMEKILMAVKDKMYVMSGSVSNFFTAMTFGALGGILSLSNSFPEITVDLYNLLAARDFEKAVPAYEKISRVSSIISGNGGVSAVKYAMDLNGYTGGFARKPLMPLTDEVKAKLKDKLAAEGMFK